MADEKSTILDAARQQTTALPSLTPASPVVFQEEIKYYAIAERAASMHREDGTRLAFMFGVLATRVKADIDYLEREIYNGHALLSRATPEQIRNYKMSTDPRGTIAAEMRPQIEASVRAELEGKIRAEIGAGAGMSDTEKLQGTGEPETTEQRIARLRKTVSTGGATVTLKDAKPLMSSEPAPLKGIVGSDSVKDGAAGSGV